MKGKDRRKRILELLAGSGAPMRGSTLAGKLEVSRQVIVQDVALLRAGGWDILATRSGYVLKTEDKPQRLFPVAHTDESILDELYTIVDMGGRITNVLVHHDVYGTLSVSLNIKSRKDASKLAENISTGQSAPLKRLTGDIHCHQVEADNIEDLDSIAQELRKKGYLRD